MLEPDCGVGGWTSESAANDPYPRALPPLVGTLLPLAAVTLMLLGCDLLTGPSQDRQIGEIGYPNNVEITIPDSVQSGQAFIVSVRTFGSDGCWRDDGTDVEVRGLIATVTPYDIHRVEAGTACTQAIIEIKHSAQLTFVGSGAAQVSVRGRDGTVTREVTVY